MARNHRTISRRVAALAFAALLAVSILLLMVLPALFAPYEVSAQDVEEGYWKQTAVDTFPYKNDERVTYSLSDGTSSIRIADAYTGDRFAASGTWSRPKAAYAGGEVAEMKMSAKIDEYVWHGVEPGMNFMRFAISVCIDEAGLEGTAHSRGVIGLEDEKGNYEAAVYTDCGKQPVPSMSLTVSAEFPPGRDDGEMRAIYVTTSSGVARYTYVWTAGPAPAPAPPGPTGGGTTGAGGKKGSKIPGPGSWWKWLTGTAIAGIIASIMGFLNSLRLFRPARFPSKPPAGFDPSQQAQDSLITQTLWNMWEDISSVPSYVTDKAKWAYNGVTDINNWKEAMEKIEGLREGLQEWTRKQAEKAMDYLTKAMRDPTMAFKDLAEAQKAMARFIAEQVIDPVLRNPLGTLKTILGAELWENAMDYRRPLLERLGFSSLATLNTIGILEGASALKNWLLGGGGKQAVVSGGKQAVVSGGKQEFKRELITPKTRLGEADLAKVPKIPVAGKKGFFDELSAAERGKLKTAWNSQMAKAESRVKDFKNAMKTGDMQERAKAILEIQRDPLAIRSLNNKDKQFIKSFNRQLKAMQNEAMENTKAQIAKEMGVSPDQLEVFKATNPSGRVKAGMDQDLTLRVRGADGKTVDIPSEKLQDIYDENFYKAAGSPKDTTPKQLGKDCRNVAVDRHDAEAFGMSPEDFNEIQLGKATSHTDTISRTMQYKADESFARADQLARSGDLKGAMAERWMGQREIVKSFNNQVKGRVEYLRSQVSPEKMATIREKVALVEENVKEVEKLINSGASPLRIDDFLRSRGTTAEGLAKQVADVYRGLTP